ncbi:unnamed protein product [Leptidea sinapis]|uniref:Uncharacterized protein n=1 Tax=Leptidea sinapis TaxID=189913 RepID=A0A5E4Q2M8_9NEOP|nr:unnamed protein product [Leptidea sinapis]
MFVNGVEIINTRLENISIDSGDVSEMDSQSKNSTINSKGKLPVLDIPPSPSIQIKDTDQTPQRIENPWLLRVQNDIPSTPPPKVEKPGGFFPQRIG